MKKRFRYWLDLRMAKGTASMVKLLLIMVLGAVVFVTVFIVLFDIYEDKSIYALLWDNLRSAMSSSFPASDSGSLLHIVLYTLLGLTGMIFTGMLIGIFSSAMRGKIIALQKDNPDIVEVNHTVVLGFRFGEYALLSEMIKAAEEEKKSIVVVDNYERMDIEQAIKENVDVPRNIRLTVINADTTNANALKCCSLSTCKAIVINTREKGKTIKTMLAIEKLIDENKRPKIIASIEANDEVFSDEILKEKGVTMLHSGNTVARIIAHSITQTGIYDALLDMIDFDNYEFYFEDKKEVVGLEFAKVTLAARKAIIIGIYRNNTALINPNKDTVIKKGDILITFEEEPGDLYFENLDNDDELVEASPIPLKPIPELTIFGINEKINTILDELPDNVENIRIVSSNNKDKETFISNNEEYASNIIYDNRNYNDEDILFNIVKNSKHVCILADSHKKDEEADTNTMVSIIKLRNIKKRFNLPFTITAEMKRENNRNLIYSKNSEDFVVASDLSSMMLAQITTDTRRADVFNELLDEEGSEAYLKTASDFNVSNIELKYSKLQRIVYSFGYILIGIKKTNESFKIIRDYNQNIELKDDDQLVVIGEE